MPSQFSVLLCALCVMVLHSSAQGESKKVSVQSTDYSAWVNCGPSNILNVAKLSIPSHITVPGSVSVSFVGELKAPVKAPVTIKLSLKRKLAWKWVKFPCLRGFGSCTYNDICQQLDEIFPGDTCPSLVMSAGGSCQCPLKPGMLTIPPTTLHIPKLVVPGFLANGKYRVEVKAFSGSQLITCVQTTVNLKVK
ncbi:hypothetical protein MATL_G00044610 [Megalops atlanticus]|uniref:MD-2-related lipid-recognition domain-containing protein n=1 Tax=Megalops atlanticus TaxID=7932 RepID=A0A9D3TGW0_MEGAT|nr:hypothetical protein MATL_G00044610 [Megalops atlanticus]